MTRFQLIVSILASTMALVLAACGTDVATVEAAQGTSGSPEGQETTDATERPDPPGLTIAASAGKKYGVCTEPVDLIAEPADFVASASDWVHVIQITEAQRQSKDGQWTFPAKVVDEDGTAVDVKLHASYWAGIDWALDNDSDVWFGMADPEIFGAEDLVAFVMVVANDGSVFFPGDCQDDNLRRPLEARFGPKLDETLRNAVRKTGRDLRDQLRPDRKNESVSDELILNPETASTELLDAMQFAVVHLRVPVPVGGQFTICTKASEGWNDCIPADSSAREGIAVDGYVGADGRLEVWLLNDNANLSKPVRKLGEVTVPAELADEAAIALDVEVQGAGAQGGRDDVVLKSVIPIDKLEESGWPGIVAVVGSEAQDATESNE